MEPQPFHRRAAPGPAETTSNLDPSLRDIVERARIEQVQERIELDFLGQLGGGTNDLLGNHDRARLVVGTLRAGLWWDCLDTFLIEEGWKSLGELGFQPDGNEGPRAVNVLRLGSEEWLEVPRNSFVFATREGQAAVFGMARSYRDETHYFVSVRSSVDAVPLLNAWGRFTAAHHRLRGRAIFPSGGRVVEDREYGWKDLYLDSSTLERIRFQLRRFLDHAPESLRRLGVRRRGGMILAGPPGTGKTLIGKILASTIERSLLWVTPAQLGGTDEVAEVMDLARLLAPSLVFLEDLDVLAEDRDRLRGNSVLGELMNQLDGGVGDHDILTIATTNRLEVLEKALRNRPGRFDRVIEIGPPSATVARAYLAARFEGHDIKALDLEWLAERAAGRTGAELEELVNTILLLALEHSEDPNASELRLDRGMLEHAIGDCQGGEQLTGVGF